jgi:hypothetical protein
MTHARCGPAEAVLSSAVIVLLAAGCGQRRADYSQVDLAQVSGVVTLDGQPLAGVTVVFEAEDRTFSSGVTDGSGRYRLRYNSEQSGATKGHKTVRITRRPSGELGAATEESPPVAEEIPSRYNTRSELTAVIDVDRHTCDFALTSQP